MKLRDLIRKAVVTCGLVSMLGGITGLGALTYSATLREQPERLKKLESLDAQLAENARTSALSDNQVLDDMYWRIKEERDRLVSDPIYKQVVKAYNDDSKHCGVIAIACLYCIGSGAVLTACGRSMCKKHAKSEAKGL